VELQFLQTEVFSKNLFLDVILRVLVD